MLITGVSNESLIHTNKQKLLIMLIINNNIIISLLPSKINSQVIVQELLIALFKNLVQLLITRLII